MKMNADAFQRILTARTLTLSQHLSGEWVQADMSESARRTAARRLQRWQEVLDRFSPGSLAKRLQWDHYTLESDRLLDRLRPGSLREDAPCADWTATAWQMANTIMHPDADADDQGYLDANDPIPFEGLFVPVIAQYRAALTNNAPEWARQFSPQARDALCRELLQRLSANLARCLEHEFSLFRLTSPAGGAQGHALYDQFISNLRDGDIAPFFLKYGYATRLASLAMCQWKDTQHRLSLHLAEDRLLLSKHFSIAPDKPVTAVRCGLSDRHHNGQSVMRIQFSGDQALYYKPRGMKLESCVAQLCEKLDASLVNIVPPVLSRDDHGWASEISGQAGDPEQYYRQAGKVIFAAWMFAGTDLHDENVMASQQGPVIIDAEMLASPVPLAHGNADPVMPSTRVEDATVLRSGLLPRWLSYGDGTAIQISGISAGKEYLTDLKTHRWAHINTDHMALQTEWVRVESANSQTLLPPPCDYEESILAGFSSLVEPARRMAASPALEQQLGEKLADCEVRFLVRDTTLYATLEQAVRHPRHALTLIDAEIEQECLAATFLSHDTCPHVWPFLAEEKRALQNGDIPHFTLPVNEIHWQSTDGKSVTLFSRSGLEAIQERFAQLSDAEIAFQTSLIKACLFTTRTEETSTITSQGKRSGIKTLSALQAASHIGDALLKMAVSHSPSPVSIPTWIAPQSLGADRPSTVRALGASLYDGQAGMGLFFAALAKRTGASRFHDISEKIFTGLLENSTGWSEELDNRHGGLVGRTAVFFALHHALRLIEMPSLEAGCATLGDTIANADFQPSGTSTDWISGQAGASAAARDCLSARHQKTHLTQLLSQFVITADMPPLVGWPDPGQRDPDAPAAFQTGAGHGISGPLSSLCQLLEALSGDAQTRQAYQAIEDCVQFLDHQWIPEKRNWKISADKHAPADSDGWAHGAVGILIALNGATALTGVRNPAAEIALQRLRERPLMQWDHLAMGNSGLIDMWLLLNEPERAHYLASQMLQRYQSQLSWAIPGGEAMQPGMMTGMAGIGYTLLRLEQPDLLPSLLTLR
ncbi:type 2 lanthipeptide synthetase LanM family protein [Alcanivorax sediminis]|uniref:Type 2 lantipeptide synthetase LanM n=1 Tax=Alcanivorax sediminis TaxID=2663008 RepID=A0A6N7LQ65_9GAMM|nr:type 2 lanthipeptide synthetase LanM family protein [Alcanivorax sediminis]MQX52418.1 type 2 lantipeptide synthetase LanM [Alcanivorax sediminis]